MTDNELTEWHLPLNQTGWHLALTASGLVKLRPHQPAPAGSARLYPGMLQAWKWFLLDGYRFGRSLITCRCTLRVKKRLPGHEMV